MKYKHWKQAVINWYSGAIQRTNILWQKRRGRFLWRRLNFLQDKLRNNNSPLQDSQELERLHELVYIEYMDLVRLHVRLDRACSVHDPVVRNPFL